MEQRLWRETYHHLTTTTTTTRFSIQPFSTLHSLITNPSASPTILTSIAETLTHFLFLIHHHHRHHHHHIFSLLTNLYHHHHHNSSPPLSLLSDPSTSPRLAAAFLSFLLSTSAVDSLDDTIIISLCYRSSVSVRVWILNNAWRFSIRPNLLVTVMLGFTKDPFPCVRNAALNGLVGACDSCVVVEDDKIVEACFFRAVELLRDHEDCVRLSAVHAVSRWGCMLATSMHEEEDKRDCYDGVFLQICSMVRDMNVGVRVEALTALGKIAFVSQDILLQTLSKKVIAIFKEKQSLALSSSKAHKLHASIAAGVFIHGLEDEYNEVQWAACISLRMLPVVSDQVAAEAIRMLSYVLNDDSVIVRLEALKTIHHMAMSGCLKMQEEHIDMLLGTLVDSSSQIRSRALNILGSVNFPDAKVSRLTVEGLLGSLDMYPKSEAEIFRTLFNVGQNHGKYAVSISQDLYHEIEPANDENFGCNSSRIAGLLVLAISASLKHEKHCRQMPLRIFSYAAAYFGRISFALSDVLDVESLLQYLYYCGGFRSDVLSETMTRPDVLPAAKGQQEEHVLNAVKLILATIRRLWQLIQYGCTDEVLKALRCCKESLVATRTGSSSYAGTVAFTLQYIRIVKLLTKVWGHFVASSNSQLDLIFEFGLLLDKLHKATLSLRYTFSGLNEDVELFIMELLLLNYVLQLSSSHTHCKTLQKVSTMVAYVGHLSAKSVVYSDFVKQLKELYSNGNFSIDSACDPIQLKKLCDLFILKDMVLTSGIKHIDTKIAVLGFDSVRPLRFISGLPVSIPLEITLYNVFKEHRLWLKISLDEATEFVFLDLDEYGILEGVNQFRFNLPCYKTPKVVAFTLRVSMGIECMSQDLHLTKGHGGPKHVLAYISPEIEVYFVNMNADHPL